jgi:hypothetical protein
MIKSSIDKKLDTGIGAYLKQGQWYASGMEEPSDIFETLHLLGRPEYRAEVDRYIAANGDRPLGMTQAELEFMRSTLRAQGYVEPALAKRVARRNQRQARKVVDELAALQREDFVVRFATGYGMTWDDQKKVLGEARVAARQLTSIAGFPINDVYSLKYPNQQAVFATIGPGKDDFNRISLMDKDLELVHILKKYVNVDGYWAPEVPSLWHRGSKFHSEVALVYPKQAVELTGKCLEPFASQATGASDLSEDD